MEETHKSCMSVTVLGTYICLLSEFTQDAIYLMRKSAQRELVTHPKSAQAASVGVKDLSISTH